MSDHTRTSQNSDKPVTAPVCPSCGTPTISGASYCHACGTAMAKAPGGGIGSAGKLAGLAAAAGVIAVAVYALVIFSQPENAPPSSSPSPPLAVLPAPMAGTPPDLSQMTQREAADRLFNRIMTASEQGNRAEAMRFVPMAVQAYGGLPMLDHDAHYHLGLIHGVAGDRIAIDRHIAALRQTAPNHLLALILEHGIAERSGNPADAARIIETFAAAYDSEIALGRPEYQAHRNTIEKFRAGAAPSAMLFPTEPAGVAQEGALLFMKNCAGCHGQGATGSDKGPPLIHKVYEPSHHNDASFYRAVRDGVQPHHWTFGPMPPISGISDGEVGKIVTYVRGLQRAAGIQ
jgi:mono/diheme cytochrome c family protein